jgi:flavin-dependent thymidylate synthase
MKVELAGFNTDIQNSSTSPETLSAAYARISRDPRPIGELRAESAGEVEKARRSNRRIVFGYGHSSVAEHAVFNLDVTGVSRVAAEYLQAFRLASYTEKSQRYIRLSEDWVIPDEITGEAAGSFSDSMKALFSLYSRAYDSLRAAGFDEEQSKEDARYVLPLCTTCQMGLTANAREMEHMTARLRAAPAGEVRRLGSALLEAVLPAAPSLFRHTSPSSVDSFAAEPFVLSGEGEVELTGWDDDSAVGTYLLRRKGGESRAGADSAWRKLSGTGRKALFDEALRGLEVHDALPRCWELARFTFELFISSSAFAQLKRHRMCTLLAPPCLPSADRTVPPSFEMAGIVSLLEEAVAISLEAASRVPGPAKAYAALNASRRRLLVSMNARELCHFSRLRADEHAQWDIRATAVEMLRLARMKAPLTLSLAGGKSSWEDLQPRA